MKKLAIFLIAVLLMGALVACGGSTDEEDYDVEYDETLRAAEESADVVDDTEDEEPDEEPDEPEEETPPTEQEREPFNLDDAIVHDLPGLTLFNHNLGGSTLLEQVTLEDWDGEASVQVLVFQDGDTWDEMSFAMSQLGGIELFYEFDSGVTVMDFIAEFMEHLEHFADDEYAPSEVGTIRVSADEQALVLPMLGPEGYDEAAIMLVQNVPGSDGVIMLGMLLDRMFWTAEDDAVLTELGTHFGVDLHEFVAAWL